MTALITAPGQTSREAFLEYQRRGGYAGLARARSEGPALTLAALEAARLRGRGGSGAGNPVAAKWRKVARAQNPTRYVIGNGAESSAVSLKDRHLMRLFPHRILEGLLIAASAVEAETACLFVRGDDEEALASMRAAVAEAGQAGLLGGVAVDVQPSMPTSISGEETAVIDALEGLEGLPQPKPPRPEESGLRGCPTLLTNVETLAAAAAVLRLGPDAFCATGTPDCPGTALFTVSGAAVERPGVYEVPYGTPLIDLLRRAGAPAPDEIEAVLPGGFSSGPLGPHELDIPLTYEDLAAVGTTLGPAAILVFTKAETDLLTLLTETVSLLTEAACGQCNGCKEGHRRLAAALAARDLPLAREQAMILQYGRGNCAHPTGTARLALRALQLVR